MARVALFLLLVACGDGGGWPDAAPADAALTGKFSVTWSVVDQNGQPISCDRIGAQAMTVLTHDITVEGGNTQIFGCSTGMGESQAMTVGKYEMDFELSGTAGVVATAPKQTPVAIEAGRVTALAPLTFQVNAVGGLALGLASGKPSGNCGAASGNGAGIEQVSITLQHNTDSSCEPITLDVSTGATQPGGTYTVNCTSPELFGCIEADQVLTASNVSSDAYTIHVKGLINGKACWANNDGITVPPLQQVLTRTLNLGQTGVPGCPP